MAGVGGWGWVGWRLETMDTKCLAPSDMAIIIIGSLEQIRM